VKRIHQKLATAVAVLALIAIGACDGPMEPEPARGLLSPTDVLAATQASDLTPTGDPAVDGWAPQGHSLDGDVFVAGAGAFRYDIYTAAFTLGSNSALVGNGWEAGDEIVAIGGIIYPDDPNPNLTHSVRIVSKFSAGNDGWSAGGTGSFSGAGGDGALLVATHSPASPSGNTQHLNPFASGSRVASALDPGVLHEIPLLQRRVGTSTVSPGTGAGKFIYLREGPDFADTFTGETAKLLSSWQVFVNVSMLDDAVAPVPQVGHRAIQSLQRTLARPPTGWRSSRPSRRRMLRP
jgi:hypothetical protein